MNNERMIKQEKDRSIVKDGGAAATVKQRDAKISLV